MHVEKKKKKIDMRQINRRASKFNNMYTWGRVRITK